MGNSFMIPRRGSAARRVWAGVLIACLTGCTTVAPIASPGKFIAGKQPRSVWLTRTNHSVVRVDGPRMVGDTVVGAVAGEYTEIPLSDVTRAAAMQNAPGKTIAVAALGGAVTVAALIVIFSHGGSSSNNAQMIADTMTLDRQF
jgi:hypothetical protein